MKCNNCGSDKYVYVLNIAEFWCPDCQFQTREFPADLDPTITDVPFIGKKPQIMDVVDFFSPPSSKPIDPRFGKLISSEGWMIINGEKVPIRDIRIAPYNPDGDPAQSYEANKKPNTTDGE